MLPTTPEALGGAAVLIGAGAAYLQFTQRSRRPMICS
jgi:hypothetical protein